MPTSNKERPKTELDFADYLFESKDYVRAIGEYKRILFSLSDTENTLKDYVNLMLGECYLTTKTYDQALYYFGSRDNPYYQYGAARTYFNQGEYATARNELKALENTKFDKERIILTGWSYYKQRDFSAGSLYFGGFSSDSQIKRLSIYDGKGIAKRSRVVSTLFSAVIPGLGQTYSGRLGDGTYSFLTVVGSALITNYYYSNDESRIKFSIFTALTTFFWAGNVYGANISARDYNHFQLKRYLQQIEDELGQIELTPKYPK
jgi:TM2 domain-containing membrane protein YozV